MSSIDLDRATRAIEEFLDALGHPTSSEPELAETGRLVAKAFGTELLSGYGTEPAEILAETLPATGSSMVAVCGIASTTVCPHHLLPATGWIHVGYLPSDQIVGLGAIGKLVHCLSRRLALQETLGQQIADALVQHLGARGAGCVVDLVPGCVVARGGRHHGARVITHAWAGSLADTSDRGSVAERAELLSAVDGWARSSR